MAKRMQVVVEDAEYRRIQRIAKRHHVTLAEWVRHVLRAAIREESKGDTDRKLTVVREAATHAYPTGDVGPMLEEIETGYATDRPE